MKKTLVALLVALMAMTSVFAAGGSEDTSADGTTTLTWAIWDYATTPYYDALINAYLTTTLSSMHMRRPTRT